MEWAAIQERLYGVEFTSHSGPRQQPPASASPAAVSGPYCESSTPQASLSTAQCWSSAEPPLPAWVHARGRAWGCQREVQHGSLTLAIGRSACVCAVHHIPPWLQAAFKGSSCALALAPLGPTAAHQSWHRGPVQPPAHAAAAHRPHHPLPSRSPAAAAREAQKAAPRRPAGGWLNGVGSKWKRVREQRQIHPQLAKARQTPYPTQPSPAHLLLCRQVAAAARPRLQGEPVQQVCGPGIRGRSTCSASQLGHPQPSTGMAPSRPAAGADWSQNARHATHTALPPHSPGFSHRAAHPPVMSAMSAVVSRWRMQQA